MLVVTKSNRDAIGARVTAWASGHQQLQEVPQRWRLHFAGGLPSAFRPRV